MNFEHWDYRNVRKINSFDFKTVKIAYERQATAEPPTYKHDGVQENRDWLKILRFERFARFEIILDFELRSEVFTKTD